MQNQGILAPELSPWKPRPQTEGQQFETGNKTFSAQFPFFQLTPPPRGALQWTAPQGEPAAELTWLCAAVPLVEVSSNENEALFGVWRVAELLDQEDGDEHISRGRASKDTRETRSETDG